MAQERRLSVSDKQPGKAPTSTPCPAHFPTTTTWRVHDPDETASRVPRGKPPSANNYIELDEWGSIIFRMVLNPEAADYRKSSWTALLTIKCADVGRLMREWFTWSAYYNILPGKSYTTDRLRSEWEATDFRHMRAWVLANRAHGDDNTQWVGELEVFIPFPELLLAVALRGVG